MNKAKLIKIVEALDDITVVEWEGIKAYINTKLPNKKLETGELTVKTLETFFINILD